MGPKGARPPTLGRPLSVSFEDNRAYGITCSERTDQPNISIDHVLRVLRKRDDRPCGGRVGVVLQNIGLFVWFWCATQNLFTNEVVHCLVGLVQPKTPEMFRGYSITGHVISDVMTDHGQYFFEDFATVLHELHVAPIGEAIGARAPQITIVVAYIVRKLCGAAC